MKRSALVSLLVGLCVAITLLAANNLEQVLQTLFAAGWGVLLVIALHLPQTFASALGWRPLIDREDRTPLWLLFRLRWIRESVNALLPVAQIGGDFVRARLLAQAGAAPKAAVASCMVDLAVEMGSQIGFTLLAVGLLLAGAHGWQEIAWAIGATVAGGLIAVSFMLSQRLGVFKLLEPLIARLSRDQEGRFLGELTNLNEAVVDLYRQPRRIWASAAFHLVSWLLGSAETWMALKVLGVAAPLSQAVVIEGLSQAVRGLAFLIPGALGVQEGGYLLICALFGISAQRALALALIRRLRELALGLPGLVLWRAMAEKGRDTLASAKA